MTKPENTTVGKSNNDENDQEQKEENNGLPASYQHSNHQENVGQVGEDTQGGREQAANGRGNFACGGRGGRGGDQRRGGRPLNNGITHTTRSQHVGTINKGKIRSHDKLPTLSSSCAQYARKYRKTPLDEPIKINAKMKEELTDHQRLNAMITVAMDRVNKLTGMDTAQCTRIWHMHDTTFLLNVSNGLIASKQECKKCKRMRTKLSLIA